MTRHGRHSTGNYGTWDVNSDGDLNYYEMDGTDAVRPVFYLTNDVLINGEGTIESPYTILVSKV